LKVKIYIRLFHESHSSIKYADTSAIIGKKKFAVNLEDRAFDTLEGWNDGILE